MGASLIDGISQGLGYTLVLIAMCLIREFLGSGSIGGGLIDISNGFRITMDGTGAGIQVCNGDAYGSLFMILPLGGFITLGCLIALMQYLLRRSAEKKELKEQEAAE